MSDALSSNAVAEDTAVIRCHCLAHGRRKFSDLVEVFPHECQVVLEVLSAVFDHDEQARQAQTTNPPSGMVSSHERRYTKHLRPWRVVWVSCSRLSKRTKSNICPL